MGHSRRVAPAPAEDATEQQKPRPRRPTRIAPSLTPSPDAVKQPPPGWLLNKSLSAIGDVIAALSQKSKHVPYRNHPLTMLMSDSIGGTAKTLMIVNASPSSEHASETANSLTFGSRCKRVKSSSGGEMAAQLKDLRKELDRMKATGAARAFRKGAELPRRKAQVPRRA